MLNTFSLKGYDPCQVEVVKRFQQHVPQAYRFPQEARLAGPFVLPHPFRER